jgi:hypothetical protein
VLWLGSNDCRISNDYEQGIEIEEYVDNLTTMIHYLIKRGIDVILITPPPLAMKSPQECQKKRYKNDEICEIRKADRTAQYANAAIDVGESFGLPICNSEHELNKAAALRDGGLCSLFEDGKRETQTIARRIFVPIAA